MLRSCRTTRSTIAPLSNRSTNSVPCSDLTCRNPLLHMSGMRLRRRQCSSARTCRERSKSLTVTTNTTCLRPCAVHRPEERTRAHMLTVYRLLNSALCAVPCALFCSFNIYPTYVEQLFLPVLMYLENAHSFDALDMLYYSERSWMLR